jgi:hypothetical protein
VTQYHLPPICAVTRSPASLDVLIRPSSVVPPDLLVDAYGVESHCQFGATAPSTVLFECASGMTGFGVVLQKRASRAGPPGHRCTPGAGPSCSRCGASLTFLPGFVTFAPTRLDTRSGAWAQVDGARTWKR